MLLRLICDSVFWRGSSETLFELLVRSNTYDFLFEIFLPPQSFTIVDDAWCHPFAAAVEARVVNTASAAVILNDASGMRAGPAPLSSTCAAPKGTACTVVLKADDAVAAHVD